jgi:pimeloyl-ACP methyl ester carboxylesterase
MICCTRRTREATSTSLVSTQHIDTGDADLVCETYGTGRLIICAHGFPDCPRTFRHQLPALVEAGWAVATPFMRAYHPSSPSRSGRYDAAALGDDLIAVADALRPDEPVALLGHDWGAVAAMAAAQRAPHRISHLVTAAVPHLRVAGRRWLRPSQLRRSWYMGLFQVPRVAERAVRKDEMALIERLWASWSPGYECPKEEMDAVKEAISPHLTEVLGYYRALLRGRADTMRAVMSKTTVPALYLHGVRDGCVGIEMTEGIAEAYTSGLRVQPIAGAGHFVHLEEPEGFNRYLLRFLGDG